MTSSSNAKLLRTVLTSVVSSIPVAIFVRDRFYSVARVQGSSMEPTLQANDVVLIRKRDMFRFHHDDIVRRYEWMEFGESPSALSVGPGQVVVLQSPVTTNNSYLIKRVVGVSGQWISHPGVHSAFRFEEMKPYSVFVEGDHKDQSIDSRLLGPVSKNLVKGVAEYVIWPPSRWQKIETRSVVDDEGLPRAVWSTDEIL